MACDISGPPCSGPRALQDAGSPGSVSRRSRGSAASGAAPIAAGAAAVLFSAPLPPVEPASASTAPAGRHALGQVARAGGEPAPEVMSEELMDSVMMQMPEEVRRHLRPEDLQHLAASWAEAESQAMLWADAEYGASAGGFGGFGGGGFGANGYYQLQGRSASTSSLPRLSQTFSGPFGSTSSGSFGSRRPRRRARWEENFSVMQMDSRRPPPLRRYFDHLPSEPSAPRQYVRPEIKRLFGPKHNGPDIWSYQHPTFAPDISEATQRRLERSSGSCHEVMMEEREKQWVNNWQLSATVDNDSINPLLRHYFDRRGLESSYRTRPALDAVTPKMRPRTPGRPSTREKILRYSQSDPALEQRRKKRGGDEEPEVDARKRGEGDISWGRRCLMYGSDASTKARPGEPKIPWVRDHNRVESEDNEGVNPLNRHYFDRDGLESSFRQRGRHYGRPLRSVMGLPPLYQTGSLQGPTTSSGAEATATAEAAAAAGLAESSEEEEERADLTVEEEAAKRSLEDKLSGGLLSQLQSWAAEEDEQLQRWTFGTWAQLVSDLKVQRLREQMHDEELEALMRKAARMFQPETDESLLRNLTQAWRSHTQNEAVSRMKRRMEEMAREAELENAMKRAAMMFGPQTDEAIRKLFFQEWRDFIARERVNTMKRKMENMAHDAKVEGIIKRAKLLFAPPTPEALLRIALQGWAGHVADEKVEAMRRQMDELTRDAKMNSVLSRARALIGPPSPEDMVKMCLRAWTDEVAEAKMQALKKKMKEKLTGNLQEMLAEATMGVVKSCLASWRQYTSQAQVQAMKHRMETEARTQALLKRAAEAFGLHSDEDLVVVFFQSWASFAAKAKMEAVREMVKTIENSKRLEEKIKQAAVLLGENTDLGVMTQVFVLWRDVIAEEKLEELKEKAEAARLEGLLQRARAHFGQRSEEHLRRAVVHGWSLVLMNSKHEKAEAKMAEMVKESEDKKKQAEAERLEAERRAQDREREMQKELDEKSKACAVM
eukprot:TRINITY_DN54828_c0_g1_i1.p1 TRINITY_DN54828_c0_g1~~TRINITY_DN54828_c0_g1_i1.p1  ORF type:complete len:1011 (-),score=303.26 TRINITY_DN54828_c0_g1_i1:72-3077(-)